MVISFCGSSLDLFCSILLVEEHDRLVGRVVRGGRLEELQARIGDVGESPGNDQPRGDAVRAVAHLDVDRDDLLAGQHALGLLQQFLLGAAELGIDVVHGPLRRPRHGLGIGVDAAILGLLDLRLLQGQGLQPGGVGIADEGLSLLGRLEDRFRGLRWNSSNMADLPLALAEDRSFRFPLRYSSYLPFRVTAMPAREPARPLAKAARDRRPQRGGSPLR